jgi:hypothetical protein
MIDHFRTADRFMARVPGLPAVAAGMAFSLRILAVIDAAALAVLGIYWIRTLPNHGALLGAATSAWLLYRAAKRVYRAVFEFEEYRWMTLRLARFALALAVIAALAKAAYWLLD